MRSRADIEAQEFADKLAADAQQWNDDNAARGGVCDFCCAECGAGKGTFTYVVESVIISTLEFITTDLGAGDVTCVDDPFWLACSACDAVIQQGDPVKLAHHAWDTQNSAVTGVATSENRALMLDSLTKLYEAFYSRNPQRVANHIEEPKEAT